MGTVAALQPRDKVFSKRREGGKGDQGDGAVDDAVEVDTRPDGDGLVEVEDDEGDDGEGEG